MNHFTSLHLPSRLLHKYERQIASTLSSDGPIFVKRKTKDNRVPELNEIVQWKETFFLNLLIQMPFEMCVSVCQKPLSVEQLAPYSPSAPIASRRMLVRKTVSKPVFANPNRSRMDKKSSKNEITYPTLYFCVNDFEDVFEDVIVRETEYLCVELSMMIPMSAAVATAAKPTTSGDGNDYEDGTGGYDTDATNATTTTLPAQLPSEVVRVTLFQGAVPFSALLDVFQSKYKENPLVKSFQRLSRSLGGHSTDETTQDTHYITMRGPGGKGHAQVAIRPVNPASNAVSSVNSRLPSPERSSNSNNVLQGLTVALKRSILTPWRLPDAEQLNEHGMHCHMTYIHLNWQSIIRDLLQEFHDYHKDAAAFINSTTTTTQTPSQ